jgi:ABC-type multidrug transport system fused ATPase/permease subunit
MMREGVLAARSTTVLLCCKTFKRFICHKINMPQKFLLYDEVTTARMTPVTVGSKCRPLGSGPELEIGMSGEVEMNACTPQDNTNMDVAASKKGIKIAGITARWTEDLPENTLTDVSVDVRPGELVAVVGPVGSGKVSCCCVVGDWGGM